MNTIKKPFTVFLCDQISGDNGYSELPFMCHIDAASPAEIEEKTLIAYRAAHGLPSEGWREFSNDNGAYPFLVFPGHINFDDIVWNGDGLSLDDCKYIWDQSPVDPFAAENYKSAFISTAHISAETLDKLNEATETRSLPYWILATEYGWLVRFDMLGAQDPDDDLERWLASRRDLMEIRDLLNKYGYQAAHLDQDGPAIEGLFEYEHC